MIPVSHLADTCSCGGWSHSLRAGSMSSGEELGPGGDYEIHRRWGRTPSHSGNTVLWAQSGPWRKHVCGQGMHLCVRAFWVIISSGPDSPSIVHVCRTCSPLRPGRGLRRPRRPIPYRLLPRRPLHCVAPVDYEESNQRHTPARPGAVRPLEEHTDTSSLSFLYGIVQTKCS